MANTLTGLTQVIYQGLNIVSREQTGYIMAASRDAKAEEVALNQIIRVPVAPKATTVNVSPSMTIPEGTDQTVDSIDMAITKSKAVQIPWTGEEVAATSSYGVILRDQFAQAFRQLASEVETDLALAAYKGSSLAVGSAGSTPFATANDLDDSAAMLQVLDDNGAPVSDRHFVPSSAAMRNLRGKQSELFKANEAGTDELLREGIITRVQGLNYHQTSFAPTHVKGTGASYQVAGGAVVGAKSVALDTGTGTILPGDVITINGVKYVVNTGVTASGQSVVLNKGLVAAAADNDAVAVGNNYVPSIALHKNALQLLARMPKMGADAAVDVMPVFDPKTGLTFRVAMYRGYGKTMIDISLAWGVKVINSNHIVTLLG